METTAFFFAVHLDPLRVSTPSCLLGTPVNLDYSVSGVPGVWPPPRFRISFWSSELETCCFSKAVI